MRRSDAGGIVNSFNPTKRQSSAKSAQKSAPPLPLSVRVPWESWGRSPSPRAGSRLGGPCPACTESPKEVECCKWDRRAVTYFSFFFWRKVDFFMTLGIGNLEDNTLDQCGLNEEANIFEMKLTSSQLPKVW